jgi:hypothetical protein
MGLYNDWLPQVAQRFQQKFESIQVAHNFDLGNEFEVAVAEVLREILPRRFGVCRGFVVARNGERAGDDIIVFDAQAFPTLRALATDLSRKEAVPAEAVLAYIEAKHTLHVEGEERVGQSLAKATSQVDLVKRIPRPAVEHHQLIRGVNLLGTFNLKPPADFPASAIPTTQRSGRDMSRAVSRTLFLPSPGVYATSVWRGPSFPTRLLPDR